VIGLEFHSRKLVGVQRGLKGMLVDFIIFNEVFAFLRTRGYIDEDLPLAVGLLLDFPPDDAVGPHHGSSPLAL
jgi:hypothetical protein